MPISGKKMLKWALKNGWYLERVKGSHHILKKDGKTVVVPVHGNEDLDKGIERSLKKQLGMR